MCLVPGQDNPVNHMSDSPLQTAMNPKAADMTESYNQTL